MSTFKFSVEDMRFYADKYRGKNITTGPHWSLVIRFPILFDEYENLVKENKNMLELLKETLENLLYVEAVATKGEENRLPSIALQLRTITDKIQGKPVEIK